MPSLAPSFSRVLMLQHILLQVDIVILAVIVCDSLSLNKLLLYGRSLHFITILYA